MKPIVWCLLCGVHTAFAAFPTRPLSGYTYEQTQAPTGDEWQSPEKIAQGKEQPHAYMFSYANDEEARQFLPEHSSYWRSLNGTWDFHWAPNPDERPKDFHSTSFSSEGWDKMEVPCNWNIAGIQRDGSLRYGVPIYVNQPVIFQHRVAVDDWRGGVMRTPPEHWTTFKHRNEVGSYRRSFDVPKDWDGRDVYISFDGVDSFFYLWINGQYVGFSKNSRNTANFNISPYLVKGENQVAVEVYRSSDGSFLEAQDMFRLPGIYRNVSLFSKPKVQITDLQVIPELTNNYEDGKLSIGAKVSNNGKKDAKDYTIDYKLFSHELYEDANKLVQGVEAEGAIEAVAAGSSEPVACELTMDSPRKWSAEKPYRYTLVATMRDKKGKVVDRVSTIVGFRQVEIKDTPASEDEFGLAGRYYYLNGKPIKLKGVNRHETAPASGHNLSREQMEQEVMLMKRANINHVRNSHYTADPYWYFLCDKYGIYQEDEANIESHQYYYGDASLSHPKEWENAHVARVMEMVHANINNPSIVIWSLGNEAGPGKNFVTAYDKLKEVDKSRPVQYERNNNIVDMGSNQYPSIAWTREAVKGKYKIKYPFHISEYAHSMGNACGNLEEYWEAIESTNFFCGGAIWDWVDQALYHYDENGKRYLAYGGDFGDTPNDGQFVMNGIIFADRTPKPQYFEVKKVYQHIDVEPVDVKQGRFEIFNKYYFKDLSEYKLVWSLYADGRVLEQGSVTAPTIAARKRQQVTIPYKHVKLDPSKEYFVKLQFQLKEETPWAEANYVQAEEQIALQTDVVRPSLLQTAMDATPLKVMEESNGVQTIQGENFVAEFDMKQGTIHQLRYGIEQVIEPGNGPKLDAMRAFVNNDNWFYSQWFENGLHDLRHKVADAQVITRPDGRVVLSFVVESQAPYGAKILGGTSSGKNSVETNKERAFGKHDFMFTTSQIWTVYPDGSIELESSITSNKPSLILPRLGYIVKVPQDYSNFSYYGRGPICNYADREEGQFIEQYESTVADQFVNFPKPQDLGNHEDVRWCALSNVSGQGAMFVAKEKMSVQALPYTSMDMILAGHPHQLPEAKDTYLRLDVGVTGLGGNSCGQGGPLVEDRIFADQHHFGFVIRPINPTQSITAQARVSLAGDLPISITRDRAGEVNVLTQDTESTILYRLNGKGRGKEYTGALNMRDGGQIEAWYKEKPEIRVNHSFEEIKEVPLTVVACSSEESGEGNAAHLVDGDPNTKWHTMYSVTVAKHPHWIDFDAGSDKVLSGITYLPRQDGSNGNVLEYQVQVSQDGKTWGEPIAKGRFANDSDEKKVMFSKAVKARFIRFTALSSHRRQDFASGAEFGVLEE